MLYHIFISLSISINETIIVFMALVWWRAQGCDGGFLFSLGFVPQPNLSF
ncbi:MAG: hypothetical protein IGQ45_09365 [Cyanobacterium sp. T60_A2020_053]|nr:hypothetical protein [Cyanobacterium sp. T60_A2020_053]